MDNCEVASWVSATYDSDIFGEPAVANVEENVACFITETNRLVVYNSMNDVVTFLLDEDVCKSVIQLKYLSLYHVVFISTKSSLIIYNPEDEKLAVLHSFTTNVANTSWNPNETFVVVVDETDALYGFSFELKQLSNQYVFTEAISGHLNGAVPNNVYVGWGSENTQFKGAKKKVAEKIEETVQPYNSPVISWRGNGEQLVINFWMNGQRYLKVFDKDLRPQFQSKAYPNLFPPTSFKGQGNFIACIARHNERNKLVIFEKNCLEKSECLVPENKGQVKHLQYHPEMNILAIYSEDSSADGVLNIYLNRNGVWYLKQQLIYPPSKKLLSFQWATFSGQHVCGLTILTSKTIERITFKLIFYSYPQTNLTAVIDGSTVHFTKLSEEIVPPPMASLSLKFEHPVVRIHYNGNGLYNPYVFLTSDGVNHKYFYENGEFKAHDGENPDCVNIQYSEMIYRLEKTIGDTSYEFLLDIKQDLLINGSVVCSNVLSVYIHGDYLLFTQASCKLFCVRLTPWNLNNWNINNFYSREVEQGAKIVSVTESAYIVIQLPRGNLETLICRVIAIDKVEKLLSENKWELAMHEIRERQLNYNLLIDLNPLRFCKHITDLIEAARSPSDLAYIVSEFSKEDCFQTVYKNCTEEIRTFTDSDKIEILKTILDKISFYPDQYLVAIVLLETKHFSLKSALRTVSRVYSDDEDSGMVKKALSHILLYRSLKDVITEALKLYDIPFLAYLYKQYSDDPTVYGPELERLGKLDPVQLRLRMNMIADDPQTTTKYLMRDNLQSEDFVAQYITKHGTQRIAYRTVWEGNKYFKVVSQLYAKHLALRAQHNKAGFVFERADLYGEALREYKRALNRQKVLSVLEMLDVEENHRTQFLLSLADALVNAKRIDEAVILYEHHCGAHEKAIEVLTEKKMFQKALGLARRHNCADALQNLIVPAIGQYRTDLFEKITELEESFAEYATRLQKIRRQKLLSFNHQPVDGNEDLENDDLYSEYGSIISSRQSSVGSGRSRESTMSSRNRRKQEKKKIDLREGGVYEDIAIIRHLYLLAVNIFECGKDVGEICLTLTDDTSFNNCRRLHQKLCTVQDMVRCSIPKIWSDTFMNAPETTESAVMAVIQNRTELDNEFRTPPPPEKLSDNWKLSMFAMSGID